MLILKHFVDCEVAIVTQTCLMTETLPVIQPEHDAGTISRRLDDSVLCGEVHSLRASKYQVREDKGFYIPNVISDDRDGARQEYFSAATDHAKHLGKAQQLLGEALNLVSLMSAALSEQGDRRAMQTETACKVIEDKLSEAYNRIDKHDRRHTNLFLAYFDLKSKAE